MNKCHRSRVVIVTVISHLDGACIEIEEPRRFMRTDVTLVSKESVLILAVLF